MSAGKPGRANGTAASPGAHEVAVLRRQVADLEAGCAEARQREGALRFAMVSVGQELNGPLSVLVSRIDLMRTEAEAHALPRAVVEDLAVLQRHIDRLARMVRVMLTHAEPRHAERAPGDRNGVVPQTPATEPREQRGRPVHPALDETRPPVRGDAVALGQAVMDLLLDARDGMETGPRAGPARR